MTWLASLLLVVVWTPPQGGAGLFKTMLSEASEQLRRLQIKYVV